jgi:hypothetical protein
MMLAELFVVATKSIVLSALGAVVGAMVKGHFEDRRLFKLRDTRNIAGLWNGSLHVPKVSKEKVTLEFQRRTFWNYRYWFNPRLVLAAMNVAGDELECRGGFCSDEYLLMDCRSKQAGHHQFGSLLLRLDASGTYLEGDVVGYYGEPYVGRMRVSKAPTGLTA